jgi:cobalt-zinc-cadmium efflux system outer membrane protein
VTYTASVRAVAVSLALAACAPSASELRAPVDRELAARIGVPVTVATQDRHVVDGLLAKPLDIDAAVRVALANNARLAAAFDQLGIAGGAVAAALAPGPMQVDVLTRHGGGSTEIEIDAIQPILSLVIGGRARAAARAELAAERANAAAVTIRLAAHVEIAMHDLYAALQEVELQRTAYAAADAAATVRERMFDAGNTTELARARDRDAREQARIELANAEAIVGAVHTRVDALLGVRRSEWQTTGALADLPGAPPGLDDLETAAVEASLELSRDREHSDAARDRLADERIRSWLPSLGLGISIIDRDYNFEIGPALQIGLPLFDWRSGPRARASAELARADHHLDAVQTELVANARATRVTALAAYAEAHRLHDVVLPLRQQIVDETLRHYNAMDADPFELIVARRELVAAGRQYLDALRRYANAMSEVAALRRGALLEEDPRDAKP